jgi:DNA-binding transcriptional ArsR family regulator
VREDRGRADDVHEVRDLRALGALAHPDRGRLMDALTVHGPSTTSALADALGLATGSVSHHLKVLVEVGLVERAEPGTDRRQSRWRRVGGALRWSPGDFRGRPAGEAAARASASVRLQRDFERARDFLATAEPPWEDAASVGQYWMRLTPDELAQLGRELDELLQRWRRREVPDDGAERRPVIALVRAFPTKP